MNEELKIVISAVTGAAQKSIKEVSASVKDLGSSAKGASGGFGAAMGKVGTAAKAAAGIAVAAFTAIFAALVALGNASKEYRAEQAKLITAFGAMGASAETAAETYKNLYRFMGESDTAVEAAGHLAKLTTNEKELAEWTTALQGVFATFGDSLPIEGLTEAANETAKVGKVTGNLADALNWAGVNEDAFNAQLATTNSESERQALIRNTLNDLYSDAALLYEKNNAEIIAANEAQARLDATTGSLGRHIQPLLTALTNLANVCLTALAPAIEVVSNAFTWFINAISTAVSWVSKFFGLMSGKGDTAATGLAAAASGASSTAAGLGAATAQAEKLKRVTAGFDELNVISTGSSSSGGSSGGGAAASGGSAPVGGVSIDTSGVTESLNEVTFKFSDFVERIKGFADQLKVVFAPTIQAFKDFGLNVGTSIQEALPNVLSGLEGYKTGFSDLFSYVAETFIPNFVNSWTTNILPLFGDITGFGITQLSENFKLMGEQFTQIVNNIIIPALATFQTISNDALTTVGEAWKTHGEELLTNLSTAFDGLRETWDTFYKEVVEPIATTILEWVTQIWEESLKPLWDTLVEAVLDIGNNLLILWNTVLKPIVDWILERIYPTVKSVIDNVLAVLSTLINTASNVIQGIITIIQGIIQFITGVFTGNWQKAWDGIKNIFSGTWQAIWGIAKGFINMIIDGLNTLWSGLYQAVKGIVDTVGDVANIVGNALGQDWGFSMPDKPPLIPKLATGGIVVSETLARIGEGGKKEAVLPLEQNTGWMDVLADKIANRSAAPSKIVLMLDGNELGWANIRSINGITEQTGHLQLMI